MIISHQYRYLFIEIPLTASWAIRKELCHYYGGSPILHKHASLPEFRKIATEDERRYFAFATVRNPLDEVVSRYFKLKSDYKQVFSDPAAVAANISDYADLEKHRFVHETDATFADYFRKYHQRTFCGIIDFSAAGLDHVIRFERLQEGFSEVLRRLGIPQVRPIPVLNKTPKRDDYWGEYYTPDLIAQAQRVFGPFMDKWGYEMPSTWGDAGVSKRDHIRYQFTFALQSIYFMHFRYKNSVAAKAVRTLRAKLVN